MVIDISTAMEGKDALRAGRTALGLSQREAVAAIGVAKHTYHQWEVGKQAPMADKTEQIARALHIPLESVPVFDGSKPYAKRPVGIIDEKRALLIEKYAPYRDRRLELGLTQTELAQKAGLKKMTVSWMECGRSEPTWASRQKIRQALGWPEERYYSVEERNELVLRMGNIIGWVLNQHREYLREAGVDLEDARQDLTLRTIVSIDRYQPVGDVPIENYVMKQLLFEVKTIRWRAIAKGLTGKGSRWLPFRTVVSLDDVNSFDDKVELEAVA